MKNKSKLTLRFGAALYSTHNAAGELELYDPANGQGELTERYLRDRAAMLAWMNKINTEDTSAFGGGTGIEVYSVPHPGTPYRFKDETSQTQIDLGGGIDPYTQVALEPQRVHFGGAGDDSFSGDAKADNLYGDAGDDTLASHEAWKEAA